MKKNLLSLLILVLLVVNIALSVVMMISVIGTNQKTADLMTSIATVMNLELYQPGGTAVKDVPLDETETYDIAKLMIPVSRQDGKQAYFIFDLGLQQNIKHADYKKYGGAEKIKSRESMIKDAVNGVVSAHTLEECQKNMDDIRDEILEAIQKLYASDFIYRVSISGVQFSN